MKRRVIAVLLVVCLVAGMVPYALAGDTPQQYKVTIEPSDHGTVTASATEANAGTVIQLTAEPEENYRLDKIAVKDSEDNEIILVPVGTNRYFFPMPASDITVTSSFRMQEEPKQYTIEIKPSENGSITASQTTAEQGALIYLTAEPDEGYEVEELLVTDSDGDEVALVFAGTNQYFFRMPEKDVVVIGSFHLEGESEEPKQYQISITPSKHGTISASCTEAAAGTVIQLTGEPDENCTLEEIVVTNAGDEEIYAVKIEENMYLFLMPASDVTVTGTFIAPERPESACPRDDTCPLAKFTDLDRKAWYHDGVHYAMENHLMVGTGSNTFEPSTTTSRAMVVTVLFRFEGEQAVGNNPFIDVPEDRWYTAAITWAAANKIIEGYGNGYFKPEDPISREEMAQILMNYAVFKGYDVSARGDLNTFADGDETSDWARRAMEWAVGEGLYQGDENNRLDPQGETLRSEFATIMMRFDANVVDKPEKTINRE